LRIGVEVLARVNYLHGGEAGFFQTAAIGVDRDRPGDAANIGGDAGGEVVGQRLLEGDVANGDTSARLQHAEDFTEDNALVRGQIDDAIADDTIDRGVGEREFVDRGKVKLDIASALSLRVAAGAVDH